METRFRERFQLPRWDQLPGPYKPLPGQMDLFADGPDPLASNELFETGRDLPGAGERDQEILWDVDA
jgi:hypothetical protein